ncbi:hypothetical protein FJY70_03480, partial [candidate division WOR-3 bacterium]|nr:hypothetical protein [candidate division WOR-3 bacterium]
MALVLKSSPPFYSPEVVRQAGRILRGGGVAVFPTETVYGLGADVRQPEAIGRVFHLKQRELTQPLMLHCASPVELLDYVQEVPEWTQPLINRFWPGPLALVFRRTDRVPGV